jgi:hypothetical protein
LGKPPTINKQKIQALLSVRSSLFVPDFFSSPTFLSTDFLHKRGGFGYFHLRNDLTDVENIDEIEKETRHVAREKDDDNADQHCSQVHLTVHILLPATVSSMRLRRKRGMWHVRKATTMQTSTAARIISRFASFFL